MKRYIKSLGEFLSESVKTDSDKSLIHNGNIYLNEDYDEVKDEVEASPEEFSKYNKEDENIISIEQIDDENTNTDDYVLTYDDFDKIFNKGSLSDRDLDAQAKKYASKNTKEIERLKQEANRFIEDDRLEDQVYNPTKTGNRDVFDRLDRLPNTIRPGSPSFNIKKAIETFSSSQLRKIVFLHLERIFLSVFYPNTFAEEGFSRLEFMRKEVEIPSIPQEAKYLYNSIYDYYVNNKSLPKKIEKIFKEQHKEYESTYYDFNRLVSEILRLRLSSKVLKMIDKEESKDKILNELEKFNIQKIEKTDINGNPVKYTENSDEQKLQTLCTETVDITNVASTTISNKPLIKKSYDISLLSSDLSYYSRAIKELISSDKTFYDYYGKLLKVGKQFSQDAEKYNQELKEYNKIVEKYKNYADETGLDISTIPEYKGKIDDLTLNKFDRIIDRLIDLDKEFFTQYNKLLQSGKTIPDELKTEYDDILEKYKKYERDNYEVDEIEDSQEISDTMEPSEIEGSPDSDSTQMVNKPRTLEDITEKYEKEVVSGSASLEYLQRLKSEVQMIIDTTKDETERESAKTLYLRITLREKRVKK